MTYVTDSRRADLLIRMDLPISFAFCSEHLISTASALAGLILLCLFGPALLAGYITERITRLFHIRWLAGVFLTIAGMIISFMWGLDGKHIALEAHTFDSVKFILTTALAGGLLAVPLQISRISAHGSSTPHSLALTIT